MAWYASSGRSLVASEGLSAWSDFLPMVVALELG